NMIGNALDAMPDGGTVSAGADRDGDNVVFFVEDEGSGVPEAIRDKIFEPFFTTKAPHGTGLGLAVVRKIAAAHGGSAGCLPRPDGRPGTRFFVSIPLEPPASVPAPAQEAAPRGEPVRHDVLLVDDDPLVLEAMEEILRHLGHSVTSCRSGPEALEALGKGSYSVVLSDIGMSPMNGFEVARRVRAASPDTRIVLMSGWSMEDREQEAYGFVDRFLQKPFRRKDVAEVLGGPAPPGRFRSAPDAGP
ncbi:MAG: response regulator, partial [Deltaproteobacteria bacterium]|nr:response regulator [Deltaproteobacteria bacterium]